MDDFNKNNSNKDTSTDKPFSLDNDIQNASDTTNNTGENSSAQTVATGDQTDWTDNANPQVITPQQTKSNGSGFKKGGKKLMGLLVAVVLLLGIGAAGLFYWSSVQPSRQDEVVKETVSIETLRIGSVEGPVNALYPDNALYGVGISQNFQTYEGLIGSRDEKFVPLLAESWSNPDQSTWVFKIRENVKFHTGTTMTAQDVKASLDSIKDKEFWGTLVSTIDSIEVTSPHEVKITTSQPDALLLNKLVLAFIYDTDAPDKSGNNGTGAYQLDTTKENDDNNSYMVAFDDYHQGTPKTRNINYRIFEDEDAIVEAVNNNEIDFTEMVTIPERDTALKNLGLAATSFETPGVFGMYMNIERSAETPLKDIEVRRAIAHAIDREGMIEELGSEGLPAMRIIPQSLPGYNPNASFPELNLDVTKKILEDKYPDGITLEYLYFEGVQTDAPVLIDQLKAAGFNIVAKPYTDPSILMGDLKSGKFDLFSASYTSDIFDARDILSSLVGKDATYTTYDKDPKYDALLEASDKEFDPTKRIIALQEVEKYIIDNLLWIPVRKTLYTAYYKPDIDLKVDYEGGNSLGFYFWKTGRIE